ncbi:MULTISPECIES: Ig-like domain-containing protein [Myxococcus]|nr:MULTISPECIES: Ig-like domain-containing protein [Myxococcus]QZZ54821.1 hypothetical protein MyxoNM_36850 [Myxococcus xanthus]UYI14448.1 Ig-like domain-containing protein [Myxococcus xanthus]UYI21815.1 Ig-like domain-containing protein [Myxococcus xanthus]SDW06863.1 hypothetical protein SAMN05444383_101124 [Myxococcus xanthus]
MPPRSTRVRWALPLLYLALGTAACDPLKSEPKPGQPPPIGEEEPPPELRVTVRTEGPEFCREGQWTLSVTVEGGTPERVELLTNEQAPMTLEAPYRHVIDCATHAEGRFSFLASAVGEEQNFEAEEASVVVDRTAPTIVSRRPLLSHPSVSAPLAFVFSEPLLPGSIQATPTQLRDQNGFSVPHQAVLSEDGTVLELVPSSPLRPPVTLHAELLQRTLTDRAGNLLEPNLSVYTRTHSATYWPFSRVTEHEGPLNTYYPVSLALGGVFPRTMPVVGFANLYSPESDEPSVARWDGHTWQQLPPLRAATERTRPAQNLQVAAHGESIVATWLERDEETGFDHIHVVRYVGTDWERVGMPHAVESDSTQVKMTLGEFGRPVLAVERLIDFLETELRVIRWTGTEWLALGDALGENPERFSSSQHAAIVVDSKVVVSWVERSVSGDTLNLHVRVFENGSWSPVGEPLPITEGTLMERVELALQDYDRVVIAWSERHTNANVSTLRLTSAALDSWRAEWAPIEQVEVLSRVSTHDSLRLVVDHDNEPWLTWSEHTPASDTKSYYRKRRATGWEPKQIISGETLSGFLLDGNAFPWALSGGAVVRPQ